MSKVKWSARVVELIAESEQVCIAIMGFWERVSFRLFLLIYFVVDLFRHLGTRSIAELRGTPAVSVRICVPNCVPLNPNLGLNHKNKSCKSIVFCGNGR